MRTAAERALNASNPDLAAPALAPGGAEGPCVTPPTLAADGASAAPSAILQTLILQTWLSPAFPVGAFAYSHGLEWAVEDGTVRDLGSLTAWLDGVVRQGTGRSDMILLAHAWRAVAADDDAGLVSVAALAAALQPTRERRLESLAQGEAFLKAVRQTWPGDGVEAVVERLAAAGLQAALPVAVGAISAAHRLALPATIASALTAFVANLSSAAVRLVPLGQTDGQRAVAALMPVVIAVASEAEAATLDDIGGASLRADIASARHETQYTRLFRS
ncbi:urease accessory protein UreF [Pseudoxanthobacter sp. M-2]|uniref:urease accessory protein UreF n=1 Tax=Pseudoxanthobacter sp. M-2 TaxID=3078754 RepID=UPI0038FC2C0D